MIRHLHKHVWQRLPRGLRRRTLFTAAGLLAPVPTPSARASLPLIVAGALSTSSGLGVAARLCHDALRREGLPTYGIDLSARLQQPIDTPEFTFDDGRGIAGSGTLIVFVNAPVMALAMLGLGRHVTAGKRIVGHWAWELPNVDPDWRPGVRFVHEIWAPTTFVADAMRPIAAGKPVHRVPYPVADRHFQAHRTVRDSAAPFTVLTVFNMASSFARKNPLAAVQAFQRAFNNDPRAHMIIKASHLDVYPAGRAALYAAVAGNTTITIIEEVYSRQQMADLFAAADCLLALHRSEGFGLPLAEAMLNGLPVVATNWSGNTDFLTPERGLPVPFSLVPSHDPQGTYQYANSQWAEPDIDAAAQCLIRLQADPALRQALGEAAMAFASTAWSAPTFTDLVRQNLDLPSA